MSVNADQPLETWIQLETKVSIDRMMKNISPAGALPGTVIASPSNNSPNYYFHWIRDASLTIDQVVTLLKNSRLSEQAIYAKRIEEFIHLSTFQQQNPGAEGLGEPRYLVDGTADTIPWSRPQFDGPALRALTLMRFMQEINPEKNLREETRIIIRHDLQYVILHWNRPCFDLWEELKGLHFYTQAVQLSALKMGIVFFNEPGDKNFSNDLQLAANSLTLELLKNWNKEQNFIGASRELTGLPYANYKASNLDSAVILAFLHSHAFEKIQTADSSNISRDQYISTARALESVFKDIYSINSLNSAPAIGRFSDDVYDGGNPWYMTTSAFAEFYFRIALDIKNSNEIQVNELNYAFLQNSLFSAKQNGPDLILKWGDVILINSVSGQKLVSSLQRRGDDFLETLRKYTGSQGEMSEQFDRRAGVPASARDLTWSYAGFLSAVQARTVFLNSGRSFQPTHSF